VHDASHFSNCLQTDYFTISLPVGQKFTYTDCVFKQHGKIPENVMALEASDRLIDII
jgi:hypothetical protein